MPRLVGKHGRDAALQGEQKRNRMRRHGRTIRLAGIAHRDPRRCAMPLDIVIAGGEQLNPFERRCGSFQRFGNPGGNEMVRADQGIALRAVAVELFLPFTMPMRPYLAISLATL